MERRYYWFTFRNAENAVVAVRAYLTFSEILARAMAERDSYRLNAVRVARAIGEHRAMTWG